MTEPNFLSGGFITTRVSPKLPNARRVSRGSRILDQNGVEWVSAGVSYLGPGSDRWVVAVQGTAKAKSIARIVEILSMAVVLTSLLTVFVLAMVGMALGYVGLAVPAFVLLGVAAVSFVLYLVFGSRYDHMVVTAESSETTSVATEIPTSRTSEV